jgi:hypothetical protein
MRFQKFVRLVWTFYKSYIFSSITITLCSLFLFAEYGLDIFIALFWFKIATLGITFFFINSYKKNEYYYYQNFGVSKLMLWATSLSFDFILFVFLIIQIYKIK